MTKWISILVLMFGLQGCITLSDISTGVGATGGAVVSSVAGLGPVATAALTVTGATAGAAVVEDTVQTVTKEVISEVQNPWQAFAVAVQALLNHAFELVIAISIAVVGIPMVVSLVIGRALPNRKTKELENENKVLKKFMEK